MLEELKSKIDAVIYKSAVFKYQGKLYQVEKYKLSWDKLAIVCTPKSLIIKANDIEAFLEELEAISQAPVARERYDIERYEFGYNKINQGLLQAFEKVQKDDTFIPKAKQMCDIA